MQKRLECRLKSLGIKHYQLSIVHCLAECSLLNLNSCKSMGDAQWAIGDEIHRHGLT
jgi:hypothetical protein